MLQKLKNVLVVEDDPIEFSIVKKAIASMKCDNLILNHAIDGEDAIQCLKINAHPELILLDLNMPKMNGLELLQYLKSDPIYKEIPVVIFTTSNDQNDKRECYKHGAAGYVVKPIDYPDYLKAVTNLLVHWDSNPKFGVKS